MPHPPGDQRTFDLHGNLLGRTIRKASARLDIVHEDVTVTLELLGRENANPSAVQPCDCDQVTVQLFGSSVFRVLDGGVQRLLAEDGTVLREPPTTAEVSRGIRELIPAIIQALAAPDTPLSERPTIPASADQSEGNAVTTRSTVPTRAC